LKQAQTNNKNIIWDQTSPTVKSRSRKIEMLCDYNKVAVFFPTPGHDELNYRLFSRPGKKIPNHILNQMINSLSVPTLEEGFDAIITIS
jgi:hypothetical protein